MLAHRSQSVIMGGIDNQLAQISTMPSAELTAEWQRRFGEPAPIVPTSLLRRALAYRVQEKMLGGLPAGAEKQLESLARDPSTVVADLPIRLKAGTRLVREWNGKLHTVLVTDDGFLLDGRRHASLSEVARSITGASGRKIAAPTNERR